MPLLLVEGGPYNQDAIEFGEQEFSIGRTLDADLTLNDTLVSTQHARIIYNDRNYWIQDLASRNGTEVNGKNVVQHQLREGDVFKIGPFSITFLIDTDALEKQRDASIEEAARA